MTPRSRRKNSPRSHTTLLQVPQWVGIPWLVHGFSTRSGGVSPCNRSGPKQEQDLNLGIVSWDSARNVQENRRRLLARLGAEEMQLATLNQIHSDLVRVFDSSSPAKDCETCEASTDSLAGDGLITNRPGLLLSVAVADCLPLLLVDARQRVVAALHCGWRGTVRRLAQKGVGLLRQRFGSRVRDLQAAIGPGIQACCYQVGEDVMAEFEGQFTYARELFTTRTEPPSPMEIKHSLYHPRFQGPLGLFQRQRIYLDLVLANRRQLRDAGVPQKQIYADALCTHCHPEQFFSYRRDGPRAGRMAGVIGMRVG